ncbi:MULTISPECIES: hypothetical protein [Bradyrhizobium]|jgi:hypothetical protein|uniref:N-acetyltransferase domain-containing protein n=1 Tax=Bradyrhizobium denitrificans TaxID=2734912 RepID=A0ABS5G1M4_9BRAD|nr:MULTISPECIES: hypothetical protein [Bradyrhizobium]MBR1135186.1 hypothetical protein [Bradyrhizobium denitrificans]MDU0954253.1 hypothetical protein [Bradyrhizobium sp.]MDU1497484.1 hypothetical protein [Bradyrhizobium sp.]MDU1547709.1 hypothetical protein [Bradyrhizobium sp.]MDU1667491.1 hypothetical protein [Bradyrhizobium sp.]
MSIGYRAEQFQRGSDVSLPYRATLLNEINSVISENWIVHAPHWSEAHSPFHDDFGIMLVWHGPALCAYTIYQRFLIDAHPVIYRSSTAIRPEHQRRGLYGRLTDFVLSDATLASAPPDGRFMAWRTRSPVVWRSLSRLCNRVAPSLADSEEHVHDLVSIADQLSAKLYPKQILEQPSLIMRDVYGHITYRTEPRCDSDIALNEWFGSNLGASCDSVFSVGALDARCSYRPT